MERLDVPLKLFVLERAEDFGDEDLGAYIHRELEPIAVALFRFNPELREIRFLLDSDPDQAERARAVAKTTIRAQRAEGAAARFTISGSVGS